MGENSVSFRVLAFAYFGICLCLALLLLFLGPVDQHLFSPDSFGFLAAGWDVMQGYRPYVDFEIDTGLIPMLFMVMGESLSGCGPITFPLSVVIPLVPVAILTWHIISRHFRSTVGFIMAVYLVLLWCDPVPLHFFFFRGGYGMYYNRESYVTLSLLLITICGRPKKENVQSHIEAGLLLGLLLFFKITYFTGGLLLLGGTFLTRKLNIRDILYTAAGFLITALPVCIYVGWDGLQAMIQIYYQLGVVRSGDSDVIETGLQLVAYETVGYTVVFGMLMWGLKIKPTIESGLVFASAFICESGGCTRFEWIDCPLLTIYALILFSRYLYPEKESNEDSHILGVIGLGWLTVPSGINLFLGLLYPLFLYHFYQESEVRFVQSTRIGMKVHVVLADIVDDGLTVLRKHLKEESGKEHCLTTLDFCDPFSYTLGIRSARHTIVTPSVGVNMDKNNHPAPELVLRGVDWVMEPHRPLSEKAVTLYVPDYMDYVRDQYKVVDRSPCWTLWELKKP